MKRILLTGANGFFAKNFIRHFEIQKLVNTPDYHIIPYRREKLDICDEKQVMQVVEKEQPHFILHTAAMADTQKCERDHQLSYAINVQGTLHLSKAAAQVHARMVFLSSEQVYNGMKTRGPFSEEDLPIPQTVYGQHKLLAEEKVQEFCSDWLILRLTWLFAFPERGIPLRSNLLWLVIRSILRQQPIKFPLHEYRGLTYIHDLLENFPALLHLPQGLYHTGSENDHSTYESVVKFAKMTGLEVNLQKILLPDEEKFQDRPKDIRITNKKLKDHGICFLSTEEAMQKLTRELGLDKRETLS